MQCKLCGSNFIKNIKNTKQKYYFCENCQLIFLDEKEMIDSREEVKRYQEHDNTPENTGYVNMFKKFISKVITPYEDDIETILEFGCGPGPVLANLLKEDGFKVDIYDPYFYPEKVYKNKKYDLITSTEVFEHLKDPYQIIKRLIKHLKKQGYLAIMTSFHPGKDQFKDWWYKWDPTHICFYNRKTFNWIAEEFDLDIIYEDGQKYCLFNYQPTRE